MDPIGSGKLKAQIVFFPRGVAAPSKMLRHRALREILARPVKTGGVTAIAPKVNGRMNYSQPRRLRSGFQITAMTAILLRPCWVNLFGIDAELL